MSAKTIKLEGDLVSALRKVKPPSLSHGSTGRWTCTSGS